MSMYFMRKYVNKNDDENSRNEKKKQKKTVSKEIFEKALN